jgi:hypothetical protein
MARLAAGRVARDDAGPAASKLATADAARPKIVPASGPRGHKGPGGRIAMMKNLNA